MHGNRRLVLAGLVLSLALVGCGDDGDATPVAATDSTPATPDSSAPTSSAPSEPSETSSPGEAIPADAPACADVWTDGAKLPRVYAGCIEQDEFIARDVLECSSGQRLVRFDDAYYAVLGGTIVAAQKSPLKKDGDYRDVIVACRA